MIWLQNKQYFGWEGTGNKEQHNTVGYYSMWGKTLQNRSNFYIRYTSEL